MDNIEVTLLGKILYNERLLLKPVLCKAEVYRTLKRLQKTYEQIGIPDELMDKVAVFRKGDIVYLKTRVPWTGAGRNDVVHDTMYREDIADTVHSMLLEIGTSK